MTKKKNKSAFTIAETIITLSLIGIIFIITINNINIGANNDYTKLYWQAFNTLYQASKSTYNEWLNKTNQKCPTTINCEINEFPCYIAKNWRGPGFDTSCCGPDDDSCATELKRQERNFEGGTTNIGRDFPGFLFLDKDEKDDNNGLTAAYMGKGLDKEFCEALISKINTLPSGRCESFISVANPKFLKDDSSQGGKNFLEAFSYAKGQEIVDKKNGITPSFTALNGQKFYISSVVTANSPKSLGSSWSAFGHDTRESYRFVVVDLNGDAKPNSQFRTKKGNPDIVLFAINAMGDVIPLGLPEISTSYINALVYFPNDLNEDGSRKYKVSTTEPVSLWEAKAKAWGVINPQDSSAPPYLRGISSAEPLSQSSKFYATATKCKDDVKKCANKDVEEGGVYADELFTHLVLQFLYEKEGSRDIYKLDSTRKASFLEENDATLIFNDEENGKKCSPLEKEADVPDCSIDFKH